MRGVIVLHGAGVFADLLAADQIGTVHLVVVADPGFEIRRLWCCGHDIAQLFIGLFALSACSLTPDQATLTASVLQLDDGA